MQLQLLRVGFCTIVGFENLFLRWPPREILALLLQDRLFSRLTLYWLIVSAARHCVSDRLLLAIPHHDDVSQTICL